MIISLSLTAICREILAESALRHHLHPQAPTPLTSDSTEALRTLISGVFASLVVELAPLLESSSISPDGEIMQLTFADNLGDASSLRPLLEHIIALRTMCAAYSGVDSSFSSSLSCRADSLRSTLNASFSLSEAPSIPVIPTRTY